MQVGEFQDGKNVFGSSALRKEIFIKLLLDVFIMHVFYGIILNIAHCAGLKVDGNEK